MRVTGQSPSHSIYLPLEIFDNLSGGTVHGEADLGRLAEGADDVRIFLAVLDAHDLDLTGLILAKTS